MLKEKGFDQWAGNYDASIPPNYKGFPFEGYYNILGFIQHLIKIQQATFEDIRILDIGVGTGLLSSHLYEQGAHITGIDFSQNMLQLAQEKMPNAHFIKHDFNEGIPSEITEKQFHYIISSYVIHHFVDEEKAQLIQQFSKLLTPQGKILIADIMFPTQQLLQTTYETHKNAWDEDEFYLTVDTFLPLLEQQQLTAQHTQLSFCAGVLEIC